MKQKKNLLFLVGILSVLLVFGFVLVGCSDDPADPGTKYKNGTKELTIWGSATEGTWEAFESAKGTYKEGVMKVTHKWDTDKWSDITLSGTYTFQDDGKKITINMPSPGDGLSGIWERQ